MKTIKTILVVGAGTMGKQIAGRAASKGYTVFLQDNSGQALQAAKLDFQKTPVASFITYCADLTSIDVSPDLIIENITEDLGAKRRLLKSLENAQLLTRDDVIVCTNTSDLLPSAISRQSDYKNRYCAMHFHSPEYGATVVDIMPHRRTDPDIAPRLSDFITSLDLDPIVLRKENPAYIYNNILNAMMDASVRLALQGVASEEEIDKAWMLNTQMEIGPFGMLDLIGLDTALAITRQRAKSSPKQWFGVRYLEKFVKQGKLGIKTGEGFYKYPNPSYKNLTVEKFRAISKPVE